jgi:hypothetical protein
MKRESLRAALVLLVFLAIVVYGIKNLYSIEDPAAHEEPMKKVIWKKPNNKISIAHTEIFGDLERPQVIFDHKKHTEALKRDEGKKEGEGCDICHPVDKEKNLMLFDFPKNVKRKDKDSVMHAFHDECINCHKEKAAKNKKAGPVVCGDCHVEELRHVEIKYPVFEFDFKVHDTHDKKLEEKKIKDTCDLCHHSYNDGDLVYEKGTEDSCYYCHDLGAKRGPGLAVETRVTKKKDLSLEKVSHIRCMNCHLYYTLKEGVSYQADKEDKKVGPIECAQCHTGKYKTVAELKDVPRPDRAQPEKPFIDIKDAKMKGVSFDHKSHEKNEKTCRGCHHETLGSCKKCHGLTGSADGNWVNTANAYHDTFSEKSCAGCHNTKKADKECAGCHVFIKPVDLATKDPKKESCALCHTGKKEGVPTPQKLSVAGLDTEKVKKEVEIDILENEYKLAKFPHMKIIERFVKTSNDSKMGAYFHAKLQTLCDGCHHQSRAEAEAKKDEPPYCRNCHSINFDPVKPNRPRLIAAYHTQCMGCHKSMKLEKPTKCKECHEEKDRRPAYKMPKPLESETPSE